MSYETGFEGAFNVEPTMDEEVLDYLQKIEHRYSKEHAPDKREFEWGHGPKEKKCGWEPLEDGTQIVWAGNNKLSDYIAWISYIVYEVLAPKGFTVNGVVDWYGDHRFDMGRIVIPDNIICVKKSRVTYEPIESDEAYLAKGISGSCIWSIDKKGASSHNSH